MDKNTDAIPLYIRPLDVFSRRNLPRCALSLALILCVQFTAYLVPTIFTPYLHLNDITLPVDPLIPFWPAFLIPYIGVFIEWGYCYMLCALLPRERFERALAALLIGYVSIFACYMLFPTTYTRPEITGDGPFYRLIEYIYGVDEPSRCLPSMHCYLGWMCWRMAHGVKRVPGYMKAILLALALITLPTTLLVKQHVILDVPAGVLFAEASWFIAGKTKLPAALGRGFDKLYARLEGLIHRQKKA